MSMTYPDVWTGNSENNQKTCKNHVGDIFTRKISLLYASLPAIIIQYPMCRLDDVEEIYYNVGTVYTEKAAHPSLPSDQSVSLEKVLPGLSKYYTK